MHFYTFTLLLLFLKEVAEGNIFFNNLKFIDETRKKNPLQFPSNKGKT